MSFSPSQRLNKQRLLQIIPGLITWAVLTMPLWLSRALPSAVAFFLTFIVVYWVYKAFIHTVGLIVGYFRYKKELEIDWRREFESLEWGMLTNPDDLPITPYALKHLIVIPILTESKEVVAGVLKGLATQNYNLEHIWVSLSIEEKHHQRVRAEIVEVLKTLPELQHVMIFVHPSGLINEVRGAASNRTWAAKNAVRRLQELGENINDFIFTTSDGDTILSKNYCARLSYAYAINPERRNRFYQTAIYLGDNNIWDVPALMRIQSNAVTFSALSTWVTEPSFKETFSCFSFALSTLVGANYWDTMISIDDTPLYWRVFHHLAGNFKGVPLYVPVHTDAVQGKDFLGSHRQQYIQLLRWGWGILTVPLAITGIFSAKISLREKTAWFLHIFERYALTYPVAILLAVGFPVLTLVNPEFEVTSYAYLLPKILSYFLTFALAFLIPAAWFRTKFVGKPPETWSRWKRFLSFFEGILVMVHIYIYAFLPFVHAETLFMLGKTLDGFAFTPKIRKSKRA